ncbi:MAG: YafY family transcriptional regulator [Clostridiales bacterium]|nr:YafY family transcriptional regulator [Clostridiales bacterium]
MQQDVLFSILTILLSQRKTSRAALSERFSLSPRTISRYLRTLEDSGVPIICEPGRHGGIMLYDDYTLDKSFFSEAETLRIKDALDRTENEYGDRANRAIIEKLDSMDKVRERDSYAVKQDDLFIDCDYEQAAVVRPKIKLFSAAIEQRRVVDIKYTDARGYVSFRSVEPYTLVFKAGAWYIYALCRLRGDFRLFKLTRISDMRVTSKSFTCTESKLVEKLGLEFYNEVYADLEFELFPTVTDSIVDWLGVDAVRERGTKLYATAEVPLNDALYKKLLSYGSSIKVISPPFLAERLAEEARLMLSVYDKGTD